MLAGSVIAKMGGVASRPGKIEPSSLRMQLTRPQMSFSNWATPRNCGKVWCGQHGGGAAPATLTVVPLAPAVVVGAAGAAGAAGEAGVAAAGAPAAAQPAMPSAATSIK